MNETEIVLPVPLRYVLRDLRASGEATLHLYADQEVGHFVMRLAPVVSLSSAADGSKTHRVHLDMRYCSSPERHRLTVDWIRQQLDNKFKGTPVPERL